MGYDPADDFAILRRRMDRIEAEAYARARDGVGGMPATFAGRVYDGGAMPTTVPGMFLVHPVTLDGVEATGEAVNVTSSSDGIAVLVLGPTVPSSGDILRARLIGGYWVAERGSVEETEVPPPLCLETPCETVWPHTLYLTDANGTHELFWNGGVGWVCCYEFEAPSTMGAICTTPTSALISVRFGVTCPTSGAGPGDPPCERVNIFMDYHIKGCSGTYYLDNTKRCTSDVDQETVNRDWFATSTSYTRSPVTASWTFPATRVDPPSTSPLPVSGTITLSE